MQYFDNFAEDEMDESTKLNLLEKGTVYALTGYIIAVAKKARKAKTYGELKTIMKKVETYLDKASDTLEDQTNKGETASEERVEDLIQDLEDQTAVITHLK